MLTNSFKDLSVGDRIEIAPFGSFGSRPVTFVIATKGSDHRSAWITDEKGTQYHESDGWRIKTDA
jgi:hypothetical protein